MPFDGATKTARPRAMIMGDLIGFIESDEALSPAVRRDLCSSVRSFCRYVNRELSLPADFLTLRVAERQFTPAVTAQGDDTERTGAPPSLLLPLMNQMAIESSDQMVVES